MTTFVPEAGQLLQAAVDHLESELMPTLEGYHRFQLRVCVNALRIVARELTQGRSLARSEHQRLQALLGDDGPLGELNGRLIDQLASGALPLETPGLTAHLRQTLRDALAINNPAWIADQGADT